MYIAWSAVLLPRKSLFSVVCGIEEMTCDSVQSQFCLLEWDNAQDRFGCCNTKVKGKGRFAGPIQHCSLMADCTLAPE
jgi:hypothetical protein